MRCVKCRHSDVCHRHERYKLVPRDKLHPCMWINEYVHHHYRPTKLTTRLCIKSTLHWTNETVNIWSHLLGFFYFSYCQYQMNVVTLPSVNASTADHAVVSLSIFGAQMCMLLSACYHTFSCVSIPNRRRWLKLDIFGISAGLLGMYLSGIYTAFFCFPDILNSYVYVLLTIFVIAAYVPTRRDFFDRKVIGDRIGLLHIVYTTIILFGMCPSFHWVQLHGGLANQHVTTWLPVIVVVYVLTAIAFFFYATLFPERCFPGAFDLVGCSHQWWHLFILAAMVWWERAGAELLVYYRTTPGSCAESLFLPDDQGGPPLTSTINATRPVY